MQFSIDNSLDILERTPVVLKTLLRGLDEEWITANEGADTWSPYDVVGHLIYGERTDWMPRIKIILNESPDKRFVSFDRFAQFRESKDKSLAQLLHEFEMLRQENLSILKTIPFSEGLLKKKGIHPEFGEVTLQQLLATWVVHDLAHICQVTRTMAKQYKEEIGPWAKYFSIFNKIS